MLILIVDHDATVQARLVEVIKKGYDVISCTDGAAAIQTLEKRTVDVVFADVEVIARAREVSPQTTYIMMPPRADFRALRDTFERLGFTSTGVAKVYSIAGGAPATSPFNAPGANSSPTSVSGTEHDRAVAQLASRGLTNLVEDLEAHLVAEAMHRTHNNQIRAAEVLKITRGALQYKLKKYVKPQAA